MKTEILVYFQICISVPLNSLNVSKIRTRSLTAYRVPSYIYLKSPHYRETSDKRPLTEFQYFVTFIHFYLILDIYYQLTFN